MPKINGLTKGLVIAGLVLIWLPILAPLFFAIVSLVTDGIFRLDYLMPAELFLSVFAGSGLLIWAAVRARTYIKWITWGLAAAIGLLFGGQGVALATGLASGEIEAAGWPFILTMGTMVAYDLAVIFIGIGGVLLARLVFKRTDA
ncbi:MAG TPA: hypothetical protein VN376_05100 [Longilinea sp.]|nr:hypothetical protein [Longilinea sp.]